MTDTTDIPPFDPGPGGRIEPVDLQVEMQRSYLDYAMSVIVQRALPDVRDGLKPVHRRVLYAMFDGGYRPDRGFSKCSRVVGDVMGQYHPHGDTAIYDTLVRLAQPWSLRYPLVQGQGNFGSPGDDRASRHAVHRVPARAARDGDGARHRRGHGRLRARTTTAAQQEPTVLPARFPNLLVNGSGGIAVGMATNIPPHNLREVAAGVQWHLRQPRGLARGAARRADRADQGAGLPDQGPDRRHAAASRTPTRTGRGSVTMRAVVEVEEDNRGRTMPGHHRAALPGQPGRAGPQDRRARRRGQDHRHRRPARRLVLTYRHAAGRRAQARRGRQGRAQQPLQAHPAAGHLRLQHARAGRRRPADPGAGRVRPALDDPPDRGHRPADPLPAARGRGAGAHPARPAQGAGRASTRSSR